MKFKIGLYWIICQLILNNSQIHECRPNKVYTEQRSNRPKTAYVLDSGALGTTNVFEMKKNIFHDAEESALSTDIFPKTSAAYQRKRNRRNTLPLQTYDDLENFDTLFTPSLIKLNGKQRSARTIADDPTDEEYSSRFGRLKEPFQTPTEDYYLASESQNTKLTDENHDITKNKPNFIPTKQEYPIEHSDDVQSKLYYREHPQYSKESAVDSKESAPQSNLRERYKNPKTVLEPTTVNWYQAVKNEENSRPAVETNNLIIPFKVQGYSTSKPFSSNRVRDLNYYFPYSSERGGTFKMYRYRRKNHAPRERHISRHSNYPFKYYKTYKVAKARDHPVKVHDSNGFYKRFSIMHHRPVLDKMSDVITEEILANSESTNSPENLSESDTNNVDQQELIVTDKPNIDYESEKYFDDTKDLVVKSKMSNQSEGTRHYSGNEMIPLSEYKKFGVQSIQGSRKIKDYPKMYKYKNKGNFDPEEHENSNLEQTHFDRNNENSLTPYDFRENSNNLARDSKAIRQNDGQESDNKATDKQMTGLKSNEMGNLNIFSNITANNDTSFPSDNKNDFINVNIIGHFFGNDIMRKKKESQSNNTTQTITGNERSKRQAFVFIITALVSVTSVVFIIAGIALLITKKRKRDKKDKLSKKHSDDNDTTVQSANDSETERERRGVVKAKSYSADSIFSQEKYDRFRSMNPMSDKEEYFLSDFHSESEGDNTGTVPNMKNARRTSSLPHTASKSYTTRRHLFKDMSQQLDPIPEDKIIDRMYINGSYDFEDDSDESRKAQNAINRRKSDSCINNRNEEPFGVKNIRNSSSSLEESNFFDGENEQNQANYTAVYLPDSLCTAKKVKMTDDTHKDNGSGSPHSQKSKGSAETNMASPWGRLLVVKRSCQRRKDLEISNEEDILVPDDHAENKETKTFGNSKGENLNNDLISEKEVSAQGVQRDNAMNNYFWTGMVRSLNKFPSHKISKLTIVNNFNV